MGSATVGGPFSVVAWYALFAYANKTLGLSLWADPFPVAEDLTYFGIKTSNNMSVHMVLT
ncbi:hypothetical protein PanWU01x14_089390, partial [Parasponia andersonii]